MEKETRQISARMKTLKRNSLLLFFASADADGLRWIPFGVGLTDACCRSEAVEGSMILERNWGLLDTAR